MIEGGQSPLLCIKINNVRNTKVLNGTDGALVCVVNVEGVEYHPIDVVLRRPKSDHGLQKNSLVFQLPAIVPRFEVAFKKKFNKDESIQPTVIVARSNIQLQYSSMPFTTLPRRSSYNSLSPATSSPSGSPRHSPQPGSMHMYVGGSGAMAGSPMGSTMGSAPIPIQLSGASAAPSPLVAPSSGGQSPMITPGSSPINITGSNPSPPLYSLSGSSPTANGINTSAEYELSGSPSMINYKPPTPIRNSASISSPTLATPAPSETEEYRIDSSLKWYKLYVAGLGTNGTQPTPTTSPIVAGANGQQPTLQHTISQVSFNTGYSESESTFSNDEVEVQLQISYEYTNLPGLVRLKSLHRDLLDMVVTPKLQLVHASCDAVDITAAAAMAKSLVDIFHCHHKLLHLLKAFIKKEVAACHDPGTLFRSNSVAMKMVVAYGHKTAQHYLAQTLTPLVVELCSSPLSLEVDPVKLQPDEDVNENIEKLKVVSQKFFDRIVQSIDQCPKSIGEICYYFKKIVSRKFPNHWRAAVGGFIFLRLFCPACVSPENAGIISPGRVGISERRALVLVAKCLQNLSNQVTFNQPYMESLNDYIASNAPILDDFFVRLATRPSEDQTIDGMMVSEESFLDGIVYVQQFLDKNQERVFKNLEAAGHPDLIKAEKLQEAIEFSKKAVLASSPVSLLQKGRSNSAGSSTSPKLGEVKKQRSNSDNKDSLRSTLSKNLKIAKQNVITPTLNVISNNFPSSKEEEVVINADFQWKENPRPAHVAVQHLLRMIVSIVKNNKLTDQQSIKLNGQPMNWALIQQTPEFTQFARDIHELQAVFFESMQPDYIAAFFINIFNLLILHLHFLLGPPNSEARRKSYSIHKYNIAGNLYSLADIQNGILRSNPKNSLTRTRQIRGGDVRRQFVIPLDPRYHFAICNVNVTLPCLRIYSPDTISEDLHKSGEEFCSSKIDICTKKKEISLPKLFSQFGTDFGKNRGEMLKWLFQFLTSSKRTELIDILEKPSYLCVYRGESWNPITYKTKFIDFDDAEEKEASEKKMSEREKVLRRKSRSLTHGNRLAPANKKDSTALSLINTLRTNSQQSIKQIVAILNQVVKRISETLDINLVTEILSLMKQTTKQLSFHEWQKSSSYVSGGAGSQQEKPVMSIKPQTQLFSNHQLHCLTPTLLLSYAPTFQELYALTLSIEKEMNKFLDFMDIASFSQANDISELLNDVAEQLTTQILDAKLEESFEVIKEALQHTIVYFNATTTAKTSGLLAAPGSSTPLEEQNISMIIKELLSDNSSNVNNQQQQSPQQQQQNNSPTFGSVNSKSIILKRDVSLINNKLNEMGDIIMKSTNIEQLSPVLAKIERIGRLISIIEEQNNAGRYSPRQSPR